MSYVLQTLEDVENKANPYAQCGAQHGDATHMEELSVDVDWNNNLVRLHVIDVCVFCEKPVGLPYIIDAHIGET